MPQGKVKWYNAIKGYGFIVSEEGEELFVHRTGLSTAGTRLNTDQKVEFEIRQGEKGLMAVNVKQID
jgi:CspA family cold shock protein